MIIRKADFTMDRDQIWQIFSAVIKSGDTYAFDPDSTEGVLDQYWFGNHVDTFVAEAGNSEIVGTYIIKPNQPGLGSHIANCGYMVRPDQRGKGIGKRLCEHSIQFAKEHGFTGIQFNIVVSTNTTAVKLWQQCGFKIIGTTPGGFRHRTLGLVDTYIMFMDLRARSMQ
jgi:GNAT superfamily N-acetyltransferase